MWEKIWEGIRAAMLALFGPPDVDDEAALLKWLNKMLGLLAWFAAQTETELDDKAIAGLKDVVHNPAKWAVVYPLIVKLFGDGVIGEAIGRGDDEAAAALNARRDVEETAGNVGIPIGLFVQVLLMLLKLLRR